MRNKADPYDTLDDTLYSGTFTDEMDLLKGFG